MRLAVLFRRPLHEVATWPSNEVRLLQQYLYREPDEGTRLEYTLARVAAQFMNFLSARGSPRVKIEDFLLFAEPWKDDPFERLSDDRYTDLDREIFGKLR